MKVNVWPLLRSTVFALATVVAFILLYQNVVAWAALWALVFLVGGLIILAVIVLYSAIRTVIHLYKGRVLSALANVLTCLVFIFCAVEPVRTVNGLDLARFYAFGDRYPLPCIKPAPELGHDAEYGFCGRHFLGPNAVRLTVYDSSDGIALPEGSQSAEWKAFVLSFEGGDLFGECSFSSKKVGRHFYFVDFNCEEPALIRR
jgi:hypothetical protein